MVRANGCHAGQQEMVRLCQASLRRPSSCAALSRSLYPPHRHLQPSSAGLRRTEGHLPMARLCPRQQAAPHDPRCSGVPAPLLPSRPTQGLRTHPPLRSALQPLPPPAAAAGTQAARRRWTRATSSAPGAELRTLALSPLRQSHASRPTLHRGATLPGSFVFLMIPYANRVSRLAPGTRPHLCVRTILQACKTTVDAIRQQLFHRRLTQLLTSSHQHRPRSLTPESIAKPRNSIQYPYTPG